MHCYNTQFGKQNLSEGKWIVYKARKHAWLAPTENTVYLSEGLMQMLEIKVGDKRLAICSSGIVFAMGARGKLIDIIYRIGFKR